MENMKLDYDQCLQRITELQQQIEQQEQQLFQHLKELPLKPLHPETLHESSSMMKSQRQSLDSK